MNGWCRREGATMTPSSTIHCQVLAPTPVCNSIFGVLILKDWQVDLHIASWFLVGALAMVWMPQPSQPFRHWWHWWQSWSCAPITLESMIWWKWRWPGWSHPKLSLSLTLVPASLWHMASLLLSCPRPKLGHLPSFCICWEVAWSWGHVLIMEIEWHRCRWNGPMVTRTPCFDVSFGGGLGDQPPVIT